MVNIMPMWDGCIWSLSCLCVRVCMVNIMSMCEGVYGLYNVCEGCVWSI